VTLKKLDGSVDRLYLPEGMLEGCLKLKPVRAAAPGELKVENKFNKKLYFITTMLLPGPGKISGN
jgi:hypothetical protein